MALEKRAFKNKDVPVTVEFNEAEPVAAWIKLDDRFADMEHLHEYVMVPAIAKNKQGKLIVVGYSFVHYKNTMPVDKFAESMKQLKSSKGYWIDPETGE